MPRAKRQKTSKSNMSNGSSAHAWADLPAQLDSAIPKVNKVAQSDGQLNAFTISNAITQEATFGIKASGGDNT